MPMLLRPISNTEIHRFCTIEAAAYAGNALNPILFPGPFPPAAHQKRVDELIRTREDDPTVVYTQAIDPASRRMIAAAKWHVYRTEEALEGRNQTRDFGPGANAEACELFFSSMAERKKSIMSNRPHVYLHMLHTDPEHQGHGAGSALLDHVMREADRLALPVYLESSPGAHRFYLNHGFVDAETLVLDFSGFGGPESYAQPLMLREPGVGK